MMDYRAVSLGIRNVPSSIIYEATFMELNYSCLQLIVFLASNNLNVNLFIMSYTTLYHSNEFLEH